MLTNTQIEEYIQNEAPDMLLFFDHEHEALLWWDKDKSLWCISFYMVDRKKVHVDPAPTMCFSRGAHNVSQTKANPNPS